MAHLRTVLATREVPTLLVTSLVGWLPTAMATLGVLLLVRGQGSGYTLAGALAALFTAGTAIGQPALARVVDRTGQVRVLIGSGAVSAVAFLLLAGAGARHPGLSVPAAAVAGLATPPLEPCLRALWPRLIADGAVLRAAFSLDVGVQEVIFVVGPVLTVAAVGTAGPRGGVLACALLGLTGTLGFAARRAPRDWQPVRAVGERHGSPLRHGVLVRAFALALASAVPVGALAIVAAGYAARHQNRSITGLALAANAAGALAAGLVGAMRPPARASSGRMALAGMALAAGYLPLALPVPVPVWLAFCVLSGLALPVLLGLVFQQVLRRSPANLLTEANAWVVTAFGIGAAVAAALAGVVTDRLPPAAATPVIVLGAAAVTALGSLVSYRRS